MHTDAEIQEFGKEKLDLLDRLIAAGLVDPPGADLGALLIDLPMPGHRGVTTKAFRDCSVGDLKGLLGPEKVPEPPRGSPTPQPEPTPVPEPAPPAPKPAPAPEPKPAPPKPTPAPEPAPPAPKPTPAPEPKPAPPAPKPTPAPEPAPPAPAPAPEPKPAPPAPKPAPAPEPPPHSVPAPAPKRHEPAPAGGSPRPWRNPAWAAVALLAIVAVGYWWKAIYRASPPEMTPPEAPSAESPWRPSDPRTARLEGGVLTVSSTREHPVWWSSSLRESATIEFDVRVDAPLDELAVEAWADGQNPRTGYRFILTGSGGGSGISREGGPTSGGGDSAAFAAPGESHHWKIVRKGNDLAWFIDGKPFAGVADSAPLTGPGHVSLGIEAGTTPVHITALRVQ